MFEKYIGKGKKCSKEHITISKNGTIRLSPTIVQNYIKKKKHVNLFYNRKKKEIGVKPINTKNCYSFCLTPAGDNSSRIITATSFLKYFNINFSKTTKTNPIWNRREKMLISRL